jgi:hypothetical protein
VEERMRRGGRATERVWNGYHRERKSVEIDLMKIYRRKLERTKKVWKRK